MSDGTLATFGFDVSQIVFFCIGSTCILFLRFIGCCVSTWWARRLRYHDADARRLLRRDLTRMAGVVAATGGVAVILRTIGNTEALANEVLAATGSHPDELTIWLIALAAVTTYILSMAGWASLKTVDPGAEWSAKTAATIEHYLMGLVVLGFASIV